MSENVLVIDENEDHSNFTLLQNILSYIGLTAFERSLYWALREAAGEKRSCTKSYAKLAKASGMSEKSVQRTLASLSLKNSFLNKPLIKIKNRLTKDGDRDTNEIILTNLWADNHLFFQKNFGEVTQTSPQVTQTPGVRSHRPEGEVTQTYKQDVFNKIPIKKNDVNAVVFFDCLKEDARLTDKNRKDLMHFSEDRVQAALQYSHEVKAKKTLMAQLIWYCTVENPPQIINNQDVNKNKTLAKKMEKFKHPYTFEASNEALLIIKGVTGKQKDVLYKQTHANFCKEIEQIAKIKLKEVV